LFFCKKNPKTIPAGTPKGAQKVTKRKKKKPSVMKPKKMLKKTPILTSEKEVGGTGERIVAT